MFSYHLKLLHYNEYLLKVEGLMFIGIAQMMYLLTVGQYLQYMNIKAIAVIKVCNGNRFQENTEFKYTSAFDFVLVV